MSEQTTKARPGPAPGSSRSATRGEILSRAELLFANVGFTGASLDMIAEAVGIRRPSVLHHFGSKRELYDQIERNIFTELAELVEQAIAHVDTPFEKLLALFDTWLTYMVARPSAARIVLRNTGDLVSRAPDPIEFSDRIVLQLETIMQEGGAAGTFHPIDSTLLVNLLGGGIINYVCNANQLGEARSYDMQSPERVDAFRHLMHRAAASILLGSD